MSCRIKIFKTTENVILCERSSLKQRKAVFEDYVGNFLGRVPEGILTRSCL